MSDVDADYDQAPFLSFDECMLYTLLDRTSLRQFLTHIDQPREHISRRKVDEAVEYHHWQLRHWASLLDEAQNRRRIIGAGRDVTLGWLLKRTRKTA